MSIKKKNFVIAFDLDEVLCTRPKGIEHLGADKYLHCVPILKNIKIANELYDKGYTIKVYTARGMTIFDGNVDSIYKNLFKITEDFLKKNNVKYHHLIMGKEHYDVLVDDKALNSYDISNKFDILNFLGENNAEK